MPFPAGVSFTHVHGKWIEAVADGPDTDQTPDSNALKGSVTATPSVKGTGIVKIGSTGMVVRPITVPIVDGMVDFYIVASIDQDTNPSDWTYRIDVRFDGGGSYFFHIEAPADGDVDLITATSVAGSGGSWVTEGPGFTAASIVGDALVLTNTSGDAVPVGTVVGQNGRDGANVLPTDEAITESITTPSSPARQALRSSFVSVGQTPVSVDLYGAIGDGTADDTAAILATITAAAGSPIALIPGARHKITSPIPITDIVGNGATIEVAADVDGLVITKNSRARDLTVAITAATWSKAALRIDTASGFSVVAQAKLSNIRLVGKSNTTGSAIEADDGGVKGVVCFLKLENVRATKFGIGLKFKNTHASSYFNGNELDLYLYDMARFIELEGICDYNIITGQAQPSGASLTGIRCSGNGNRFPMVIWDADSYPNFITHDFTIAGNPGSYNRITGTGTTGAARLANANPSNAVDGQAMTGIVLPKAKERAQYRTKSGTTVNTLENFLGIQDDVLKFADKNYTVTCTPAPTSGALASAFRFGQAMPAWDLPAGGTLTVTIDLANEPLTAVAIIGVQFGFANFPNAVSITSETAAGVQTVQESTTSLASPLLWTRKQVGGTVAKIHVTMSVVEARAVRLAGIFASSGAQSQKSFMQVDGSVPMWGDVRFGEPGIGPVLVAPNGTRYRLTVANGGTLTVTPI